MMRFFQRLILCGAVVGASAVLALGPGFAAGNTAPKTTIDDQKRALILEFFESKPPRALVDASIEAIATGRYGSDDPARDEFISRMQVAVDYDRIEALALQIMADLYTVPELQAMITYYGSAAGQSAESKAKDLRAKIAPELKAMLDHGVLDVVTSQSPAERATP